MCRDTVPRCYNETVGAYLRSKTRRRIDGSIASQSAHNSSIHAITNIDLNRRRLGRSNLAVTELGLGCYMFTGDFGIPQSEAGAIMDAAIECGIN